MTYPKGQVSTADNPCGSKVMLWFAEHRSHQGDACLIWPFARDANGYGSTGRNGKKVWAHRYMCELVNGPPPTPKYHAAHTCNNGYGGCVNPKHLTWKTPSANQYEGKAHPRYVLTPEAVADIRTGQASDLGYSRKYNVRPSTIQKVRLGQTWKTGDYAGGRPRVNALSSHKQQDGCNG